MKKGYAVLVLVILVLSCLASLAAGEYYADVTIAVGADGSATISGTTNHPGLIVRDSEDLTSKKGNFWLLNVSPDGIFSDYVYKVTLPDNAAVNFVKAPGSFRISEEGSRLVLTGTGHEEAFDIEVQYSIQKEIGTDYGILAGWFGPMLGLIVLGAILYMIGRAKPGKAATNLPYDADTLTERQLQIVSLMRDNKGVVTQAEVERSIRIPKSSISRNIDSLARKGIIVKQKRGMSNVLRFATRQDGGSTLK